MKDLAMRRIARIWHDDMPADNSHNGHAPTARSGAAPQRPMRDAAHPGTPAPALRDDTQPFVSVVVVARGGDGALVRCLEALAGQSYPVARMEVIVVGLTPRADLVTAVAAQARRRPGLRLRYVTCPPGKGIAAARNCGWRHARGDLVAFTSDTAIPSAEWVAAGANAFGPTIDVVGGMVVVPLPARPAASVREAVRRIQAPWSATNVFYRRQLLSTLDGFDELLGDADHDATDLALAARATGAHFTTSERAVVVHATPAGRWLAEVRSQRVHLDEARLYTKHPGLYWRHVRSRPPLGLYARVGLLLLSTVGLLGRRRVLATSASAAWLALTVVTFARDARGTSDDPRDLVDLLITSALVPPVALAYRLRGALRERVWFL
jgi:GT2 family glycosyltransferase